MFPASRGREHDPQAGARMQQHMIYQLEEGVQVRREAFGLLFYNYRGPRLYFVPTQDLIGDAFFNSRQTVGELVEQACETGAWPRKWIENRIHQALGLLEGKGLIRGESVC